MYKSLLVTLVLFFTASLSAHSNNAPRRSNGLLRFIAERQEVSDFALSSVIGSRCSRYLPNSEKATCRDAVKKMIAILDYDVIFSDDKNYPQMPEENWNPRSFVFVAFKKNLINLLSNPSTTVYLNDLNQKLYQFLLGEKTKLNVWDVTLGHFKTDYMTAMILATLFQDTSHMKLHLAYLERAGIQGNQSFQANKELLSRVIDAVNLILDSSEEHYRSLFYPEEIQKNLNRNIYHFYVPLFLSKSLAKSGVTKKDAFSAALMLTLSYEFVTSAKNYRYLFSDPENIENIHKIKDIFGGYCGANLGVKKKHFHKSFEIIHESFIRSTEDTVTFLLRN